MMKSFLCSVLLLAATVAAKAMPKSQHHVERATTTDFTLYAYGGSTEAEAIGGLPLIYADGKAYIGTSKPPGTSSFTNVTFTISNSQLISNATNSSKLYIEPDSSDLNQSGFTDSGNSTAVTDGFLLFGKSIFWENDDGGYESYFYAVATDSSDVYKLTWGKDGANLSNAVPVALRSVQPSNGKLKHKRMLRDMR